MSSVQMPRITCSDGWSRAVLGLPNEIVKWRFYTIRVGLSKQSAQILINRLTHEVYYWKTSFHHGSVA